MLTFTAQDFIRAEALKISYFVCKKTGKSIALYNIL